MNIQLSNTEEWIDGKESASLGQVLIRSVGSTAGDLWTRISEFFLWFEDMMKKSADGCDNRCNNVLWISGAKEKGGDVKMGG